MKKLISQGIIYFLVAATFVWSQFVFAEDKLLSPEQAFHFRLNRHNRIPQSYRGRFSRIIIYININLPYNRAISL